jgi:hypothetical protein
MENKFIFFYFLYIITFLTTKQWPKRKRTSISNKKKKEKFTKIKVMNLHKTIEILSFSVFLLFSFPWVKESLIYLRSQC